MRRMSASNRWNGVGSGLADGADSLMGKNVASPRPAHKPFRFPLHCRLRKSGIATSELGPCQPLSDESGDGFQESPLICVLPFIEAESLFVQVAEKVEGFDADIRSLDRPLQETPEVFQSVRVNAVFHIALGMVNDLVREIFRETRVRAQGVRVDFRSLQDILADVPLQFGALRACHAL